MRQQKARSKAIGYKAAPHTIVSQAPTGHTAMHRGTMRCEHCNNHQMRRTPLANKPPLPLRGARKLHKGGGCAPRAGRCPARGWQQGRDQPTACGTVNVIRRCEIRVRGGTWVGQEWVRKRGIQERQHTGGGATQTQRTREPHHEGRGGAQQTRRRGAARQERQPGQGTRMEGMGERAHVRQRQQSRAVLKDRDFFFC